MSQKPIFDRSQLDSMTGGDPDLAMEILRIFLDQVTSWSRLLDPKSDPKSWSDGAHAIKGTALSVGAMRLAEFCEKAEKRGRDGDVPQLEAILLVNDINTCMAQTKEKVAFALHEAESSKIRDEQSGKVWPV